MTYGAVENIFALKDANIRAYTPLPGFDQRALFYGKQCFTYEADQD
jgi:hypothetical protein